MSELKENYFFANRYLLIKRLGSGAYSEVWKAVDTLADQLTVAIKIFAPDKGMDENGIAIFSQEYSLVFNLAHQNLLRPNHFDQCNGSPYLVLPFCTKGSAEKLIGGMNEQDVVKFIHDVASALEFLHNQNPPIIHQDIKPDNVLVAENGDYKLTDFGISTRIRSTLRKTIQMNESVGTTAFMAPERFNRNPDPIKASDIWSLGATVFELMTGNVPFGELGGSSLKNGADIPEIKGDYSEELKNLVEKCLSKEPWDRPMAYQLKELTERFLKTGSWKEKEIKHVNKKKTLILSSVITVFVLALIGGGIIWDYNRLKVRYYKDYVEQWGVPQGIGKLNKNDVSHRSESYRFEYRKRQLQRMSFVNSKGKVVAHHDSEHMERPSDLFLYYGDNGNLDYVKSLDINGKVLFKKAYNDKLNVVTFQRDDEYGTELTLAARTLQIFTNPFDGQSDSRGRISRYLLTYNEKGFVTKIQYAGFQNVLLGDNDGIFGRSYVLDDKGRVIEEHYLAYDGTPKATKKGLAIKKHRFIENDDWVETSYHTIDEQPAMDETGVPIVKLDYDEYGNRIKESYVDYSGNFVIRTDTKCAGFVYKYDENGNNIERGLIDIENKKCYGTSGYSIIKMEYDDNGFVNKQSFFDPYGNICSSSEGNAIMEIINDDKGNIIELWNYDENNQLTDNVYGFCGIIFAYDSIGNMTQRITYGTDRQPCFSSDGSAGYKMEYNTFNKVSKLTYLGENLEPYIGDNEFVSWKAEYDKRGNQTKLSFYDKNDQLTLSGEGIAGWNSIYDENGNEIERAFFNCKNKPCLVNNDYAKWKTKYDDLGNMLEITYYGTDDRIIKIKDDISGKKYKYDDRGNILEEFPFGINGELASNKLISKYKYDLHDNEIEMALFGKGNTPALNTNNWHKRIQKYNDRNQIVEIQYFDKNNQLTYYGNDNYAIVKYEYDEKGNKIKSFYYNNKNKPCVSVEGWASSKYEYDNMNRVIKQFFYDIEGDPTQPSIMVPEGFVQYDNWGNKIYLATGDGNGKIIMNPKFGWAIQKWEYDIRGNELWHAYYDENQKLCAPKGKTYCKVSNSYNQKGDLIEENYYNESGNLRTSEYSTVKYLYDEMNRVSDISYFNHKGQKGIWFGDIHKVENIYDHSSTVLLFQKCYRKDGSLYGTWDNKKSEWVNQSTSYSSSNVSTNWKSYFDVDVPIKINSDLSITKLSTTNTACIMTIKLENESKYAISENTLANYKSDINDFAQSTKSESKMPSNITLKIIVVDKANRELFKILK